MPVYQGLARAGAPDWPGGEVTPIRAPSETQYGQFDVVDEIVGPKGLPTLSLSMRMQRDLDDMLTLFQQGCPIDIQIHVGSCTDPTDFLAFEKIHVLEAARMTNYGGSNLGAFDADEEAVATLELPFTGLDYFDVVPIRDTQLAGTQVIQEVVGIVICDTVSCGACGVPSNGANVVFAVTMSAGGSPGLPAELIFTDDGGNTIGETTVDTIGANEDPTGIACVGKDIVIISAEDNALHYAPIDDILAGIETWTRVATGFVALKIPNAIFSLGRTRTWIVADGGYIYFSDDITSGVEPQTAGAVTVQNLTAIHGVDEDNLVAVGASNAVLFTENGGETWGSVTGPNVGVALTAIWMRTRLEWLVGDAGGNLWYTRDGGVNWTAKAFSGSGAGAVDDIQFASATVGYMAHRTATPVGRIFRTVNGGSSWYALPEAVGVTLTAADGFNHLVVPRGAPSNIANNQVWAAGLADNAVDGIILKVA